MQMLGLSLEEARKQLSKQSGLLGLSRVSNDIRDVAESANQAMRTRGWRSTFYVTSARHWIGGYFLELNGADALVFTAGTGEKPGGFAAQRSARTSKTLESGSTPTKNNATRATEALISAADSPVKIFVIPTNEVRVGGGPRSQTISGDPEQLNFEPTKNNKY